MIYETTDIKLGATILCEIPGTRLKEVDNKKLINNKMVLRIEYPVHHTQSLSKLIDDYTRKIQLVNVYKYNRALCVIRDALRDNGLGTERMRTTGVRSGDF